MVMVITFIQIEEEKLYPIISEWLRHVVGCQFACEKRFLWGKQPDVIGIKFSNTNKLRADLHLAEVKIIDSLNSAYNLIGEIETKIAQFLMENSAFYSLHVYMAIFEYNCFQELRTYARHRGVGIIKIKDHKNAVLSLEKSPVPIISGKTLSMEQLKGESWITDKDEARVFRDAVKHVGWWKLKELLSQS